MEYDAALENVSSPVCTWLKMTETLEESEAIWSSVGYWRTGRARPRGWRPASDFLWLCEVEGEHFVEALVGGQRGIQGIQGIHFLRNRSKWREQIGQRYYKGHRWQGWFQTFPITEVDSISFASRSTVTGVTSILVICGWVKTYYYVLLRPDAACCPESSHGVYCKHCPSTCSKTCAGPVLWDFPDGEP